MRYILVIVAMVLFMFPDLLTLIDAPNIFIKIGICVIITIIGVAQIIGYVWEFFDKK